MTRRANVAGRAERSGQLNILVLMQVNAWGSRAPRFKQSLATNTVLHHVSVCDDASPCGSTDWLQSDCIRTCHMRCTRRSIDPTAGGFEAALVRGMSGHPLRPNMSYRSRRSSKDPDERDLEAAAAKCSGIFHTQPRAARRAFATRAALSAAHLIGLSSRPARCDCPTAQCANRALFAFRTTRPTHDVSLIYALLTAESIYVIVFRS